VEYLEKMGELLGYPITLLEPVVERSILFGKIASTAYDSDRSFGALVAFPNMCNGLTIENTIKRWNKLEILTTFVVCVP
jgi:hypothetical protein